MKNTVWLALLFCSVLAEQDQQKTQGKLFDYRLRVGVVEINRTEALCLTIYNAELSEGDRVRVIRLEKPQSVVEAQIAGKLREGCSAYSDEDTDQSFYSLRAKDESIDKEFVGICVVGTRGVWSKQGDLIGMPFDTGKNHYFRSCTSHEGLHLTAWEGLPLKGTRRWHWYYYLGYDVIPNCTEREVSEPFTNML